MDLDDAPSVDSMFRVQTLLFLRDNINKGISGYDLMIEIERLTGNKPSAGKLYPFLKQLSEANFLDEAADEDTSRNKTLYKLTEKGIELVNDIMQRMRNLIDARTNLLLDVCDHCGVTLYEAKVIEVGEDGIERKYCCTHCRDSQAGHGSH